MSLDAEYQIFVIWKPNYLGIYWMSNIYGCFCYSSCCILIPVSWKQKTTLECLRYSPPWSQWKQGGRWILEYGPLGSTSESKNTGPASCVWQQQKVHYINLLCLLNSSYGRRGRFWCWEDKREGGKWSSHIVHYCLMSYNLPELFYEQEFCCDFILN